MNQTAHASWVAAGFGVATKLLTERLCLRPMEMSDAPALHHFFSDPIAMQHWSKPHATFADTENWVRMTVESPANETREFTILRDGDIIGKAGIWKAPQLGYFLRRDCWGNGYMSETLAALIPHLSETMGLSVMTAEVDPQNEPSIKLLKQFGFRETRRGKKDYFDGVKWVDTAYYERQS